MIGSNEERIPGAIEVVGGTLRGGTVAVQGSKNATQKVLPLTALVPGKYRLTRVPDIADTHAILDVLEHLGARVQYGDGTCDVDTRVIRNRPVPRSLTMHATGTFLFSAVLGARFGWSDVGLPGGDEIGARPVGLHIELLGKLGAVSSEHDETVTLDCESLSGANLTMRIPSTGVLMSVVAAAARATGPTRIEGAPWDADIAAGLHFLADLGAGVQVTHRDDARYVDVEVTPISKPATVRGAHCELPPDRNDAATWAMAGALARSPVTVVGAAPREIEQLLNLLAVIGCDVEVNGSTVVVSKTRELVAPRERVVVGASPMLHSDWSQMLTVVLATCRGASTILDTMYDNRTSHIGPLERMGANVRTVEVAVASGMMMFDASADRATAIEVAGSAPLNATEASTRDVRGSMALVLAGAIATGVSRIDSLHQLRRGYELLEQRLQGLGVECHDV